MKMSRISIEVTEIDIARAYRNNSYQCVVAQAIARTIPTANHIDVDTQTIRFTTDEQRYQYLTPYAVQGYVIAFDAGDQIQPFTFQLRDPKILRRRVATTIGKAGKAAGELERKHAKAEGASEPEVKARASKARAKAIEEAKTVDVKEHKRRTPGSKADDLTPKDFLAVSELASEGDRPTPKVFKKKRRNYGHRVLRVNWEE